MDEKRQSAGAGAADGAGKPGKIAGQGGEGKCENAAGQGGEGKRENAVGQGGEGKHENAAGQGGEGKRENAAGQSDEGKHENAAGQSGEGKPGKIAGQGGEGKTGKIAGATGAEIADRAAGAEKADRAAGAEKGAQRTDGLPRGAGKRRRRAVYRKDLPKQIYLYFLRAAEAGEIPSLHKFAVLSGMTTEELTGFRRRAEFDRAVRECEAIRKDLLIDAALGKKVDGTFAKFLLAAEFGMGEKDEGSDRELAVTLEVVR